MRGRAVNGWYIVHKYLIINRDHVYCRAAVRRRGIKYCNQLRGGPPNANPWKPSAHCSRFKNPGRNEEIAEGIVSITMEYFDTVHWSRITARFIGEHRGTGAKCSFTRLTLLSR